jgi:hypothetical protein
MIGARTGRTNRQHLLQELASVAGIGTERLPGKQSNRTPPDLKT